MVTVGGNGGGDPCSDPGLRCFHFLIALINLRNVDI